MFDLVEKLSAVELDSTPLLLGGSEIRLMQFADDIVIIARSAEDFELLLSRFEKYSDESHQITSLTKTQAMIVSFDGDSLTFDKMRCRDIFAKLRFFGMATKILFAHTNLGARIFLPNLSTNSPGSTL